jgi:hypothetical protein
MMPSILSYLKDYRLSIGNVLVPSYLLATGAHNLEMLRTEMTNMDE